jgi:hypothetical protein
MLVFSKQSAIQTGKMLRELLLLDMELSLGITGISLSSYREQDTYPHPVLLSPTAPFEDRL